MYLCRKATGMFSTRDDAQKAIDEYSGKEYEGSEIKIEFTKGKEELGKQTFTLCYEKDCYLLNCYGK